MTKRKCTLLVLRLLEAQPRRAQSTRAVTAPSRWNAKASLRLYLKGAALHERQRTCYAARPGPGLTPAKRIEGSHSFRSVRLSGDGPALRRLHGSRGNA